MLVERIAGAPEVRAAIAAQGAGLITDIGVRLTVITEHFDDALERVVRRRDADSETDQAGLATRSVAAAVDLGLMFAGFALIAGVVSSLFTAVSGKHPSLAWLIVGWSLVVITGGAIFAAFWSLAGQTPGMRFLSIRLISLDSRRITFGRALQRVFGAILSLLPLGLGYLASLRDPSRHAWHDRMTRTEVIYDVAARTAPHAGISSTSSADASVIPGAPNRPCQDLRACAAIEQQRGCQAAACPPSDAQHDRSREARFRIRADCCSTRAIRQPGPSR